MNAVEPVPGGSEFTPDGPSLEELRANSRDTARFREHRRAIVSGLSRGFETGADIDALIHGHAAQVDALLTLIWEQHGLGHGEALCLAAVGGYGRGELHPSSDIDILILAEPESEAEHAETISRFVTFLWDIGLEVGHSVRSIAECEREAENDITIATTLFEARLLVGPEAMYDRFRDAMQPDRLWDSRSFYAAKLAEQQTRHQRFGETAYRLEPNVKEGPGGLRDIQMIGWVSKRHFAAEKLRELVDHGFLREGEFRDLIEGQRFLWKVRFALHMLTGRREDRLLFDLQRALASTFGFTDQHENLGVEQFMQRYFRTICELQRLNELLLQHFNEALLEDPASLQEPKRIHQRFQVRGGYLELVHDQVFMIYPPALLEVFHLIQTHPEILGIRASTIRLIRAHLHLIDGQFRRNPVCRRLFMTILRAPQGVTTELRRMNRFGVLGAYIPAFGRIIGRMQYDLFHAFTVDEHTLNVVRNARRLFIPDFHHELPLASDIAARIERPERLILGALFHDIAKGRGGDHSELGALDALHFCQHHGLGDEDSALVSWLVRSHLLMSLTAQRRDISDPEVVLGFAREVRTLERLDLLYLLTTADIRGTNPALWNSWKDSLLQTLYHATVAVLERGLDTPPDVDEQIGETCSQALRLLARRGLNEETVEAIWSEFEVEYFVRHSADEIAWHTRALAGIRDSDLPLVLVRHETPRGSTEIFVYAEDCPKLFARIANSLTQLGLDIVDARVITTHCGHTLDTFMVLESMGHAVEPGFRVDEIRSVLRERLLDPSFDHHPVERSLPRRLKHFDVDTRVSFSPGAPGTSTRMNVRALDRPGLLSTIGCVFADHGINVRTARISTAGEQAEDQFLLVNADGGSLSTEEEQALRERLLEEI
ncbi:[protein-PII] uridylyltransferase [Thioalkalivibrio sp.]|uniref:[protein-PII] uridylyltransferase n=1 Tax=Thioalkalivibrio sp. TaxID=2093813 RepID=UPI003562F366